MEMWTIFAGFICVLVCGELIKKWIWPEPKDRTEEIKVMLTEIKESIRNLR